MKHGILSFVLTMLLAWTAMGGPIRDQHVEAELLSEVSAVQPGAPFWVALKLVHDEHWHTYWINDGDSGLPTSIRWELPEGFRADPIVWPYPERIDMPPLVSFGYEGEAWLLTRIHPPENLDVNEVTLKARVSWLMCKEICIPGRAALALNLPVSDGTRLNPALAGAFSEARRRIPAEETGWTFLVEASPEAVILTARPPDGEAVWSRLDVFPVDKEVLANSALPQWEKTDAGVRVTLPRENTVNPLPETFRAVLVAEPTLARDANRPALAIDIPFTAGVPEGMAAPGAGLPVEHRLWVISIFAFIGGIILNLMPCVFPVISLKILGFVKQAGEDPRAVWRHGLVFAAGVVVSFWLLAGVLLALRAGGAGIGWGFQLQSPEVLIVLALLFFTLALNLFGVFEVGLSLTSVGGTAAHKAGWGGSFFSGFLATIIATPCTAPFMGVALGYALTQPAYVALTVFTALALGMAAPYLLLSRYPALLRALPRPGPWMETMKQIMGFFLVATVIWLLWVLSALAAASTLIAVLAAFFLVALAVWILGKWDAISRSTGVRWRARIIAWPLIGLAVFLGLSSVRAAETSGSAVASSEWRDFSPELLEELLAEGQPVFIDFTAKWCLTCQVNKLTVLRTGEIMQAFRDRGVVLLYADWTDENEVIARELSKHGRQSVPVYALYDGRADAPPVLLPEILTRRIVLDALKNLN
ncbi:MAG TPA: protein-disulfide reductase DsbD family protein [Kiritimatiellia bacterium]|nr:protein-disulfide reductase DsbD family protein [Kiritimatiellia bacterium]